MIDRITAIAAIVTIILAAAYLTAHAIILGGLQ